MAKNETTWKPGQSGNPNGRPKKQRALTEILARQGGRTLEDIDGKRRGGKYIVARALWEIATTGKTTLPGDPPMTLLPAPQEWIKVVQWLYQHIDGPAVTRLSHEGTGKDGAIKIDDARADYHARSLSTLTDALGGLLDERRPAEPGVVDATEQATVGRGAESSG